MKKFICTSLLLFLTFSLASAQKSWCVNNILVVDADFTKLSDAVSVAEAGDTIYVESSPTGYSGTANINKKLFILGTGYFLSDSINPKTRWNRNDAQVSYTYLKPGSTGSVISGLRTSSIRISDSAVIIERCYTSTINLANSANSFANNSIIRQNYISGSIESKTKTGTAKDLLFHNNIITQSVSFSSNLDNITAYFINNNFNGIASCPALNCVFQNNIFRNGNFGAYPGVNTFYNNIDRLSYLPETNGNIINLELDDVYVDYNGGNSNPSEGFSKKAVR